MTKKIWLMIKLSRWIITRWQTMTAESSYLSPECSREHPKHVNLVSCSTPDRCNCTCHLPSKLHVDLDGTPNPNYWSFPETTDLWSTEWFAKRQGIWEINYWRCWNNYYVFDGQIRFIALKKTEDQFFMLQLI